MSGKIQNEDVKSLSELLAAGGVLAQLPNDTKIYVTSLAKQLSQAFADGDIGGSSLPPLIKTASYSIAPTDSFIIADMTSGGFNFTLPTAVGKLGKTYRVQRYDTTPNYTANGQLQAAGGEFIRGLSSVGLMTQGEEWLIVSDNVGWRVVSHNSVSPWTQYTQAITGTISNPTKATSPVLDNAYWRRVGDSVEISYIYNGGVGTGAAAGSGIYLFPLPNSIQADSSKINTSAGGNITSPQVGIAQYVDNSTNASNPTMGVASLWDFFNIGLQVFGVSSGPAVYPWQEVGPASGNSLANAQSRISFRATVPILGWDY
jgi:hypothetical protein